MAHKDLSEASIFLLPHFSFFLSVFFFGYLFPISDFFFFGSLSFSCLRPQISSFICIRSRDFRWHIFNGRYSSNVPHTFTSDDKPCYLHADLPLRCSPLGSLRKRFGLFKCQFSFFPLSQMCSLLCQQGKVSCKKPM